MEIRKKTKLIHGKYKCNTDDAMDKAEKCQLFIFSCRGARIHCSTAERPRAISRKHAQNTNSTWLASITIAAQTINPTKAYLRIAPDPTLPAGP